MDKKTLAFSLGLILMIFLASSFVPPSYGQTSCNFNAWNELPGGGRTDFAPAAVAVSARSEIYTFAKGAGGPAIFYQINRDGIWRQVPGLPGNSFATSEPSAAFYGGRIILVVRGIYGLIYQNSLNPSSGAWSGWQEIPGGMSALAAPSVVAYGSPFSGGQIEYYATGADGQLYVKYYTDSYLLPGTSPWSDWTRVPSLPGGNAIGGPTVVVFEGKTHLFIRGFDDLIYENVKEPGGWRRWMVVPGGGLTLDKPGAAVYERDRELHLFVRGYNNAVYRHIKNSSGIWNAASWQEVFPYNGRTTGSPAAAFLPGNRLDLFIKSYGEQIHYNPCQVLPG